jgi:hypothetical protein
MYETYFAKVVKFLVVGFFGCAAMCGKRSIILFYFIFYLCIAHMKKLLYCVLRAWIGTKNWINLSTFLEKTP